MGEYNSSDIASYKYNLKRSLDPETLLYIFDKHSNLPNLSFRFKDIYISSRLVSTGYRERDVGDRHMIGLYDDYNLVCVGDMSAYDCHLRHIMKHVVKVYYKNSTGVWYDASAVIENFAATELNSISTLLNIGASGHDAFKLSYQQIPENIFIDFKDKSMHNINICDGYFDKGLEATNLDSPLLVHRPIFTDDLDTDIVSVEQCKIGESIDVTPLHMKDDLHVMLSFPAKDMLVWFNGYFINFIKDSQNPNAFYIQKAKRLYSILQPLGDTTELYYDMKLRIFRFEDISFGDWKGLSTIAYKKSHIWTDLLGLGKTINLTFKEIDIPDVLTFTEEIGYDTHIIMCDGRIVDTSEYIIDSDNRHNVHMRHNFHEASSMISKVVRDNYDVVGTTNHVSMAQSVTTRVGEMMNARVYRSIRVSHSSNPNTKPRIIRSRPIGVDYPKIGDVCYGGNVASDELLLVDGYYVEYFFNSDTGLIEYEMTNRSGLNYSSITAKNIPIRAFEKETYVDSTISIPDTFTKTSNLRRIQFV